MPIVVAVAGAGDVVTGGLWHILEQAPEIEVQHEYPRVGTRPDLLLYDVMGLQGDGGAQLARLVANDVLVLVVGRDLRPDLATRAVGHGAAGWVSLEAPAGEILSTIRAVATGELRAQGWALPRLGCEARLSSREAQILGDIVRGLSNEEIAHQRSLSPNTVKSYIRATYRKIGATSRSQAACWGLRHGFDPAE